MKDKYRWLTVIEESKYWQFLLETKMEMEREIGERRQRKPMLVKLFQVKGMFIDL